MSSSQPITKKPVGADLLARVDQTARPRSVLRSLGNTHPAMRKAPQTEATPQGVPECHQEGGLPTKASPNRFLRRLECSREKGCPETGVKTTSQPSSGRRLLRTIRTSCPRVSVHGCDTFGPNIRQARKPQANAFTGIYSSTRGSVIVYPPFTGPPPESAGRQPS